MTRRLFTPDRVNFTAFDLCGVEMQRKGDRLSCRCQTCGNNWELSATRLNQTAAATDWQCPNRCNAEAQRRSNPFPNPGTFARAAHKKTSYQTSW